jgi:hypothetical protein
MVYHIEQMSHSAQQNAKAALSRMMYRKRGYGLLDIPNLTGIGITEGAVLVVVEDEHPSLDLLPTELDEDSGFNGLPVIVDYGKLYPLQGGGMACRTQGVSQGLIMGGVQVRANEFGTTMLVGVGTQNSQQYAIVSSHITGSGKSSATIAGQRLSPYKDAGCGNVYFEGTAMSIPQGARSSFNIAGLGQPKGIKKAAVGMNCHSNSCTSGKLDGRVTAINFDAPNRRTLGPNTCAVSIHDMFISCCTSTHR